jgi:hypothetical protein
MGTILVTLKPFMQRKEAIPILSISMNLDQRMSHIQLGLLHIEVHQTIDGDVRIGTKRFP